ncbi:MAG: cell division ATP-binding protein FtsE [Thermoanaerobaculia bacterium]
MIHFYHVTKKFDRYTTALSDVNFQIDKGEFVFLTGPSGAGKSTLLKLILRQLVPTEGQIIVNGRNLSALKRSQLPYFRRELGMVFQDFKLIERMTVYENLAFVMTVLGISAKEQKRKAYGVLRTVNLHNRMNAFPPQLSGGEQQRVAIARALINDPMVLIADEPTGNLDPELTREILQIFLDANVRGSTVLLATHDRELIHSTGKRVISLERGRVAEEKPPTEAAPQRRTTPFANWS